MSKHLTRMIFSGTLCIAAASNITHAAVLIDGTTLNGGFEGPDLSVAGSAKQGFDMAGKDSAAWVNTTTTYGGAAGASYNDVGVDFNAGGAHSGNQFAFFHGGEGGAYNMTTYVIQAGDQFSLTWWGRADSIAMRLFSSTDGSYGTATTLAEIVQIQDDPGGFAQYLLAYSAVATDVGKTIGVSIFNPDVGYANVDDVMLTVVPETSSSVLLIGGAALITRRSRKRHNAA